LFGTANLGAFRRYIMVRNKLLPLATISSFFLALLFAIAGANADTKVPAPLTPGNSAIVLLDHQKTTVAWVKSLPKESMIQNVRMLARIGSELGVPLVVTTTMETQVGATIQDVQDLAATAYANRVKRGGTINAFLDAGFAKAVKATGRKNLIMAGLTTDICLFHTVQGALRAGYNVWVVADASGSMTPLADELTYAYVRSLGVTVVTANSLLSELYPDFGTPAGGKAMKINLEEVVSKLK
jgi:nicotinamidase-related amidase